MKKTLLFLSTIICSLVLSSCIEVKFQETQPKGIESLDQFPQELKGTFINQDGDTLVIGSKNISLRNRKSKCDRLFEHDSLSNTVQLKQWEGNYFLNITEDSLWTVGLIEKQNNGDFIFSLIDAESDSTIKLIHEITSVETIYYDDEPELYIVDPNHNSLSKMISKEAFSIHYHFRKIEN